MKHKHEFRKIKQPEKVKLSITDQCSCGVTR